jgi:hypothetical protein
MRRHDGKELQTIDQCARQLFNDDYQFRGNLPYRERSWTISDLEGSGRGWTEYFGIFLEALKETTTTLQGYPASWPKFETTISRIQI